MTSLELDVEQFLLLAPLKSLSKKDVEDLTTLDRLKTWKEKSTINEKISELQNLSQFKNDMNYKKAIVNENIISFIRDADPTKLEQRPFLVIIDKRPKTFIVNDSQSLRYNFYQIEKHSMYCKGKIWLTTSCKLKVDQYVNLTNVHLQPGDAYVFELYFIHENYDDSYEWWQKGVIYELLVSSYQDSNNDGMGDINGLRRRLDYIEQLGVKTIWLAPIYDTPWKDYGYDIRDFCSIDKRFGTMSDFEALINDIHSRHMKIILDFVPNHTSDEHPWFLKAKAGDKKYMDYFIWHKGNANEQVDGHNGLPNNWLGCSGLPMWTWCPELEVYYLHQFLDCQPDLNFRNPHVLEEIELILKFWLDKGIDGFRGDAIRHLVEDEKYKDEPKSGQEKNPVMYMYYKHIYTANQDEDYEIVIRWRKFLDEYSIKNERDYILFITEAYDADVKKVVQYHGSSRMERGSDCCINFFICHYLDLKDKKDGLALNKYLSDWYSHIPDWSWCNWDLGSHDSRRVTSRLPSKELIDGFHMILLLSPGTALSYYGDEIGMCDRPFTIENRSEILDITAFNYGDENVAEKVRDPQRTPMQWTADENAGFTLPSTKPYLPLSSNYINVNVEKQLCDERSHLKLYRQLVKLREQPPFYGGNYKVVLVNKDIFSFIRFINEQYPVYLIILNVNGSEKKSVYTCNFGKELKIKDGKVEVVVRSNNIQSDSPLATEGNLLDISSIPLGSSEAVVVKLVQCDNLSHCFKF